MYAQATSLVTRLAEMFNGRDVRAIADCFVFPLPVQVQDDLIVFHTAERMTEALLFYRANNVQQGLSPSVPRIAAIDLPRNGRFRLWVDWNYPETPGMQTQKTQNIYYCSASGGHIVIEMVQYLRVAAQGELLVPIRRIA